MHANDKFWESFLMYVNEKKSVYVLVLLALTACCFVWHDDDSVTLRGRCLP